MLLFYLLVGALLIYLGLQIMRTLTSLPPAQVVALGKWVPRILVGAAVLFLLASGRANAAMEALGALALLFVRWGAVFQSLRGTTATPGQSSQVETGWLRMTLEHDSGRMDGVVLQGTRRGAKLSECGREELLALLAELRVQDSEAAALLEAYLDRAHAEWRGGATAGAPPTSSNAMTREEAYRILGLEPGADDKAVRAAHRRLIQKLHPDQGGSTYLAAKINQAKDLLTHP